MKKIKYFVLLFLLCFLFIASSCNKEELFEYSHITLVNYLDDSKSYSGIQIKEIKDKSIYDIIIPEEINGEKVVSIGDYAFSNCFKLKSIYIPETVKEIGKEAFSTDINLEKITLPNSVISIGIDAFKNCNALKCNEKDNGLYIGNDSNPYLCLLKIKENKNYFKIDDNCKFLLEGSFEDSQLDYLIINKSLIYVPDNAFGYKAQVHKIYYSGSEEEWNNFIDLIIKNHTNDNNNQIFSATKYYYSINKDKETKEGLYWYYDTDNKIVEKINK